MELLTLAGINVAVAFAAFLRRQNAALAQRFEAFSRDITGTITGIDRRLARCWKAGSNATAAGVLWIRPDRPSPTGCA